MKNCNMALIGNPNSGKSTLFNALTGQSQYTGNWAGVTVSQKTGQYIENDHAVNVIDLPGIYYFENPQAILAKDETVTCECILKNTPDIIVNVINSANIERSLYLTTQLQELDVPMIIVVNMMDLSAKQGIKIDLKKLSSIFNCTILAMEAGNKKQLAAIKRSINLVSNSKKKQHTQKTTLSFNSNIEKALQDIQNHSEFNKIAALNGKRWQTIKFLEGQSSTNLLLDNFATKLRNKIEQTQQKDIEITIASERYNRIAQIVKKIQKNKNALEESLSARIDKIALHRIFGVPVFLATMYMVFFCSMSISKIFSECFELITEAIFIDGLQSILVQLNSPEWAINIFAIGVGNGIRSVSAFIPVIFLLFCFLSILEKSGYMSRAIIIIDKLMGYLGLPGKAFVPMLIGFGCNVPAIMAARTMENERDKLLTISMIPFMSCSARLPVYTLFVSLFFPYNSENIIFLLYMAGIVAALFTAFIMKKSILGKFAQAPAFVELSNYQLPSIKEITYNSWKRTKSFVVKAGKLIIIISSLLNLFCSIDANNPLQKSDINNSILSKAAKSITPAFSSMGISEENWPATVGIITGFLAKETVIGTLRALYSADSPSVDNSTNTENAETFNFTNKILLALKTIPNNFKGLFSEADKDNLTASQNIVFHQNITKSFNSVYAVIAYLLFILLYTPCVAVIGVIYKEASAFWAAIISLWSLFLAYAVATLYYQLSQIASHPWHTLLWVLGIIQVIFIFMISVRRYTKSAFINKNAYV